MEELLPNGEHNVAGKETPSPEHKINGNLEVDQIQTSITMSNNNTNQNQQGEEMEVAGDDNSLSSDQEANVTVSPHIEIIQPHSMLPKPEPPPGVSTPPSSNDDASKNSAIDMQIIGKFLKEQSNSLSASIVKRLSFNDEDMEKVDLNATDFNISGIKVVVQLKNDDEFKGRISFFSRSNCRDCTAVRSFLRQRGLNFVEINIDVYPLREAELIQRTGSSQVPQIFFNDKLFGGLVALNSLRNSGCFDQRLKEMLESKCSSDAPKPPVYGIDDHEEGSTDEMIEVVRLLRQRLPIQDRLMKMKIVKNCFAGSEMVEVLIHHLDCGRKKAVEIGKQLVKKHFIHHVFGENDFVDGWHFYRFLEHEPFIPKCYNFQASTNDYEPKPAAMISQRLYKILSAILESCASDDRCHVDYDGISKSEEFRRYVNLVQDLQREDVLELSTDERLAFFLNLYNAMVIHAIISVGCPKGVIDRRSFYSDFQYIVGGFPFSLNTIKNGILRNNRRSPYSFVKPFSNGDNRLEMAVLKVNPLIHFGLCNGTRSSPSVRFFSGNGVEAELRYAAREFLQGNGVEVDIEKRTVYLTRIIKWFSGDFGQDREILKWIMNYLDATKAGLLSHLFGDGGPINIVYQDYDWSVNS